MNLKITSMINAIIFFSFLGHFGIKIFGQDVYYYYIIEIILIKLLLITSGLKLKFSDTNIKLIFFFFILCVFSSLISIFADVNNFKGQSIKFSSLKGLVYLSLNILMIFLIYTYCRNENFFKGLVKTLKYLIFLYIIYIFLESYHDYYSYNEFIREILNFFHTSSRSIDKGFLNLLGHEHSNSSVFVIILYSFMIANLINRKRVFGKFFFDVGVIVILIIAIFLLESKLGYLIFGIINIFIPVIYLTLK